MSVVKSKRKKSEPQFIMTARALQIYTLQKCSHYTKKTHIVKLSHGFVWLKCRFYLLSSGGVVRKIYKKSVTRQRQKTKKMQRLYNKGRLTLENMRGNVQSWLAYALHFDACMTVKGMTNLLWHLFGIQNTRYLIKVEKLKYSLKPKIRCVQYLTSGIAQIAA